MSKDGECTKQIVKTFQALILIQNGISFLNRYKTM